MAFSVLPSVAVSGIWQENGIGYSHSIFRVHRAARRIRVIAVFGGAWCTSHVLEVTSEIGIFRVCKPYAATKNFQTS